MKWLRRLRHRLIWNDYGARCSCGNWSSGVLGTNASTEGAEQWFITQFESHLDEVGA